MRRLIFAAALVLLVAPAPARAPRHHVKAVPIFSWDFVGEGRRAARLSDCPAGTKATISFNSGVNHPWRRFCYWGIK